MKVLQLHLIVVQQSSKKLVDGGGESPLMEVSEGHDVAVGWRRRVLITGQPPILGGGPRTKKTTAYKALQALEGDVRVAPQTHWKMGMGGCKLNGG